MLLATLVLLAPLSACGPTGTADEREAAAPAAEQTSPVPVDSPAPQEDPEERTAAEQTTPEQTPEQTSEAGEPSATPAPEQTTPAPAPEASDGTALAMLAGLEQKGRAPKTGYDRDFFGWRDDLDRNGCDTRNDVLRRDLEQITLKSGTGGCVVLLGTLTSPYSGESVSFDRSHSTVDIDHVVALSDAWQTGAAGWDEDTRREFANDPLNLLAVEASLNRQKGAGDAATWLPPKKDYRCEYVARQIAVKDKYGLWVKPAEGEAMERVLGDCDGFLALEDDHPWPGTGGGDVIATETEPTRAPAPKPAPKESGSSSGGDVHYTNCDAARTAGAAPVHAGEPGYGKHLDRDGDGVGCE